MSTRTRTRPHLRIVKDDGVASVAEMQADIDNSIRARNADHLPASTCAALDFIITQKNPERLRQFLKNRSAAELALIRAYLKGNP
jgi:hypothetical protein